MSQNQPWLDRLSIFRWITKAGPDESLLVGENHSLDSIPELKLGEHNAAEGVAWVHSYLSEDKRKTVMVPRAGVEPARPCGHRFLRQGLAF
jgi:hypothetical protein